MSALRRQRRKDRPLEWFLAGYLGFWAAAEAVSNGRIQDVTLVAAALSVAHVVGLIVNGARDWTPLLRLAATAGSAGVCAFTTARLHAPGSEGEALNAAYAALGFLWCALAAGRDVARMRLGTYGL